MNPVRFLSILLAAASILSLNRIDAATLAGTQIRNQASATYVDSAGRPQVSTSNEVINVVAPIYGLEILPNQSATEAPGNFTGTAAAAQQAAPGNIVYYSYYLTNEGNAADTFKLRFIQSAADSIDATNVGIFVDANGNGVVDPGDIQLISAGGTSSDFVNATATPLVQAGATLPLVLAVTVPNTATNGNTIDIDIDAQSIGDTGEQDAVSNFSRTTISQGQGVLSLNKAVDKLTADPGNTITYTIFGSNVGTDPVEGKEYLAAGTDGIFLDTDNNGAFEGVEGLLITDVAIDEVFLDLTTIDFSTASKSFSSAIFLFGNASGQYYGANTIALINGTPAAATIDRIAIFIPEGSNDIVLQSGQAFSFSFSVNIQGSATFDGADATKVIENTVSAKYNDGTTEQTVTSNKALTSVDNQESTDNLGVQLSPFTFDDAGTASNNAITNGSVRASQQHPAVDTTTAYPQATLIATADITTASNRNAGDFFAIPVTVTNTGSVPDTYSITTSGVPVGYQAFLFKSDGVTPLGDTNSDGVRDSGPVAAGAQVDIIVKVLIPPTANQVLTDQDITVTATSVTDGTITNPTTLTIAQVRPAGVDIAIDAQTFDSTDNTVASHVLADASGDGDSDGNTIDAGSTLSVNIEVRNVRAVPGTAAVRRTGVADTYTLTWAAVDAGNDVDEDWTVQFFRDGGAQPISDTADLDPDEVTDLDLKISVPDGFAAGTYILAITATSANDAADISDVMYVAVTVNENRLIKIDPDNTATAVRGGTVTFNHVVSNIGNTNENITLTATSADGYQVVFIDDDGTVLGTTITSAQLAALATAPGADVNVRVRVFIPQNAPVGSSSVFTITATGSAGGTPPTDTAVDVVQIIDGNLQLTKTTDPATGTPVKPTDATADPNPGTERKDNLFPIRYTTTFQNLGSDPITNVTIVDQIPANTRLVIEAKTSPNVDTPSDDRDTLAPLATPPATKTLTTEYSTDGGVSWSGSAPAAANDGSASSVTHIRFVLTEALAPGESGSVRFDVLID